MSTRMIRMTFTGGLVTSWQRTWSCRKRVAAAMRCSLVLHVREGHLCSPLTLQPS